MLGSFGLGSSYEEIEQFTIEYFPDKKPPFSIYDYGTALGLPRIGKEYLAHISKWALESDTAPLYDGKEAVDAWVAENLPVHAGYLKDALILAFFCDEDALDEVVGGLCGQLHKGFMQTAPATVMRYINREIGRK